MNEQCATPRCNRPAAWYSVEEVRVQPKLPPRRCTVCCDAISEAMYIKSAV